MKKRMIYAILTSVLCIVSCKKDFITLAPQTSLNTATYFKNADQFQQALIGVYQVLRAWANPTGWLMGESRTDNSRYDFNSSRAVAIIERENVDDWTDDANNNTTKNKYTADFAGIERANIILDQLAGPNGANLDATTRNTITGETEILRAFFYFDLVQFYGDVPLNLHTVSGPSQAFLPRSPASAVYAVIVSDLTDAIQKMPKTVTFPQVGRVSLGTAELLLANVYMVQKKFDLAIPLLQNITQLGFKLNANYADVYSTTNKNSVESIFEVQYMQGASAGQFSAFIYDFIPPQANTTVVTGVNTNTNGYASSQNQPTQDIIDAYEPGDKRLDPSIGIIEGHYDAGANFVSDAVKSVIGYTTPPGKIAKTFVRKYLHPSTTAGQTDDNWPIYRYAEALLSLAECLNEQSRGGEALPYLNQVRARAGLAAIVQTDQTALRAIIAHERRIELAFENKRWTDLLRTGQVIPVMTAFGNKIKQNPLVPANAYNITANRLLFPIPASEIQVNPMITQNPGY